MNIILYRSQDSLGEALEEFLSSYHSGRMKSLASDLLEKGYSPLEIAEAVRTAINICRTAGLDPREHFFPVYTQHHGQMIKDCKLSKLGYGLVLMNGPAHRAATAEFQLRLLRK